LNGVGLQYAEVEALKDATLNFSLGEFVAIAGPNGAGKSTILSIMAGLRAQYRGSCVYRGKEVRHWSRRDFARRVTVVPQSVRIDFSFTAEQVVLMGRTPFANAMFESAEDFAHVDRALRLTGAFEFRHRDFRTLSGGEKQRVVLASALAQTPEALLLDEPTTYLDLEHQLSLYRLLRTLSREGVLVVTITHDLNLAATYCDRLVLLHRGEVRRDGPPEHVLHSATLREIFRVDLVVEPGATGRPWIRYEA
jgi:iron complex transport system ATP-binding protein